MPSTYPTTLDALATNKANSTPLVSDHPQHHNDLADAINKIEAALGRLPAGTVRRLASTVEAINVKDPQYGAKGDGTTDDTTAMQAAISAATVGQKIFIPAGTYKTPGLILPNDKGLTFEGAGEQATNILISADAGAGHYGIDLTSPDSSGGYIATWIKNLRLTGPGTGSLGVSPANMHGFRVGSRTRLWGVSAVGFRAGAVLWSDHCSIEYAHLGGNYYGVYTAMSGTTQSGDQYLGHVTLDGNYFASLACGPATGSGAIGGVLFEDTHFGWSPYGIYRETGAANQNFILGSVFDRCSFEFVGNAVIYDEDASGIISDVDFLNANGQSTWSASFKIAARNADYAIRIGALSGVRMNSGLLLFAGAVGLIDAHNYVTGLEWGGVGAIDNCVTNSKKVFSQGVTSGTGDESNRIRAEAPANGYLSAVQNAVARHDLLQADSFGQCKKWHPADGKAAVGSAAFASSAAGDPMIVLDEGTTAVKSGANVINAGQFVKPDTANDGQIQAATGPTDGQVLGVAWSSNSGGFTTIRYNRLR